MKQIEFTQQIQFGETTIDSITVAPMLFHEYVGIWQAVANEVRGKDANVNAIMQRKRLALQTHFMSAGKRIFPDAANISQLPIAVGKQIVASLDIFEGKRGELLSGEKAEGINIPLHYKLGTPIEVTMNGKRQALEEIEFQAQTFGDIEDILAEDGEVPQAYALIRKIGRPIGLGSITSIPGWALQRITVADGVTIMQQILPRFLG